MKNNICAVIPAAGKGSRLGSNVPKILVEFNDKIKVIDIILGALVKHVDKILIVVSKDSKLLIQNEINEKCKSGMFEIDFVELVVQEEQKGMGDAVFCAYDIWKNFESIFIIWGDQASVSEQTVLQTILTQSKSSGPCFTIPLVKKSDLYVEYVLNSKGKLEKILQKREKDILNEIGYSDAAIFSLSTNSIFEFWNKFLAESQKGKITNEINFLPFLVYLSKNNWINNFVYIEDDFQTVGLNTPEDYQKLLKHFEKGHLHERQNI